MRHVIGGRARYAVLPIRVESADTANFSVSFLGVKSKEQPTPGKTPTLINLTDINWWDIENERAEHTLILERPRCPGGGQCSRYGDHAVVSGPGSDSRRQNVYD